MKVPADGPAFFSPQDLAKAAKIVEGCKNAGWMLATAESCTGGLVSALLTEVAGSSAVVERGFVTYSNEAKITLLGLGEDVLARFGAVSAETAQAMAEGALANSRAKIAVSITGIAGPGGGSADKPVGLVHFGLAVAGCPTVLAEKRFAPTTRTAVRRAALLQALSMLGDALPGVRSVDQAVP